MSQKGFFITFEGGDGSSKTTQAKLLRHYLQNAGFKVLLTREPGGTALGERLRDIILQENTTNITDLLLVMAARSEHLDKVIKPALKEGVVVICDRFIDSTATYQATSDLSIDSIYQLHAMMFDNLMPDLTILLSLEPEEALKRAQKRNETLEDKMETKGLNFHLDVFEKYHQISRLFPSRVKVIDANRDIQEIKEEVINIIRAIQYFKNRL